VELALGIRILATGLAFGLVVFVHELGHFLAARLAGMAVHEFSIGFGRPLLFWFRRRDTQYSFRLWPFFSYVRVAGMEPEDDHPQGFYKKSRPAQASVLVIGSVMNFLLAVAIFIVMGAAIGMPVSVNTMERVFEDSPAARAGLMPGDRIVGVAGRVNLSVPQIREAIQASPEKPMVLEIERAGARRSITVTPRLEEGWEIKGIKLKKIRFGLIGVQFGYRMEPMGWGQSVIHGFVGTYEMIVGQMALLIGVLGKTVPAEFVGPVGIANVMYKEAKESWWQFLNLFAILTAAVGFINLLPIPPLDGSRLVIVGIEGIRRRPFDKRKELVVHLVGFLLFLFLAVVIAYKDVLRILSGSTPMK